MKLAKEPKLICLRCRAFILSILIVATPLQAYCQSTEKKLPATGALVQTAAEKGGATSSTTINKDTTSSGITQNSTVRIDSPGKGSTSSGVTSTTISESQGVHHNSMLVGERARDSVAMGRTPASPNQSRTSIASVVPSADRQPASLSAVGQQLAEQLEVSSSLNELLRAKQSQPSWRTDPAVRLLRQDLLEMLFTAELEVRTANARLDEEIALADELRAKLEERRDKALNLTAGANLLTGAFNGVGGNSLDFSEKLALPAKILDVVEGGITVALAGMALKQQAGERKVSRPIGGMLARLFEGGSNTDFPTTVWTFLNTVPADGSTAGATRKDVLINEWVRQGVIRRGRAKWEHRLNHITGTANLDRHRLTISVLEDRAAMLHDLRAAISKMDECLLNIMRVVRSP